MPDFKMRNTDVGPLSEMFTGLGAFTSAQEVHVANKVLEDGVDFMRSIVPQDSEILKGSITVQPVTRVLFAAGEDGAYRGAVGSPLPRARFVDMGTGVDGPFKDPVSITRRSRTGNRDGVMRFNDDGKWKFRRVVKFNHSNKIKAGKGFVARTDEYMKLRTEQLVGEMKFALKSYTQLFTGRSVRRPR